MLTPLKDNLMDNLIRVKIANDGDGHWYVLPEYLYKDFNIDLEDTEMLDSGEFSAKYGKYATGGDINIVELFANVKE